MKNFEQFYEDVKTDPELQKQLAAIDAARESDDARAVMESMLPAIRQAGYDFTYDDMEAYARAEMPGSSNEMSMEELDAVAGGGSTDIGGCCIGIGLGLDGDSSDWCFCIIGGGGNETGYAAGGDKFRCILFGGG